MSHLFFFFTNKTGDENGLLLSLMIPSCNISVINLEIIYILAVGVAVGLDIDGFSVG